MEGFDPRKSFNSNVARHYDDQLRGDEDDAATFLTELAGDEPALEFAIGTGRIALPLAAKGVTVDGIELSEAMVARLREKLGGDALHVTIGDMSATRLERQYGVVYLVYNTVFNLLTADAQVCCFENAARHLTKDGVFVVETAIPSAWISPDRSEYVKAEHVGLNEVRLDVVRYDPVTQIFDESHVRLTASGITMVPIVLRLITPGEMDLMARIAGLRLVERCGSWRRAPFDASSRSHVSVYSLA